MATTTNGSDAPIGSLADLLLPFHEACKPRSAFRVGTEAEKQGLLADTLEPLPWSGERSVQRVLAELATRFGWKPEREHEHAEVIALLRDRASITLEPAGQLELSGAPQPSIHDTCREFRDHLREVGEVSKDLGIVWISLGFHPFATHADLPRVPKSRYGIMERYLPTRGPRGLDMMRRTCTVQANLDYSSESDAMRKLRVSLALQPITTAIFANSPFYEGRRSQRLSERADVWLNMDPDRSGILPFAWQRELSFRAYVEWALDAPMFMLKRGARVIPNTEQTFRRFLEDGKDGERATLTDWKMHLNTLFPEVRLKNTLEMRGADAQPLDRTCALPALWKGVLDDETSLARAEQLISPLDAETVQHARPEIATRGLAAMLAGRTVQSWSSDLLDIAASGLARIGLYDENGKDESIHLARVRAAVAQGKTTADVLLDQIDPNAPLRPQLVTLARVA